MLQVVLEEPGRFVPTTAHAPSPRPGEALVRVRRIGVCGTDLHAFAGRQPFFEYPRILGHELGIEIVEIVPGDGASNDNLSLRVGDRCAVEPYVRCGQCRACRMGRYNCCETLQCLGVHTDGGMRESFCVPLEL